MFKAGGGGGGSSSYMPSKPARNAVFWGWFHLPQTVHQITKHSEKNSKTWRLKCKGLKKLRYLFVFSSVQEKFKR